MYGCQQILISPNKELGAVLEFLCGESNKLANCGTYYARQLFFKTGKIPGKFDLHRELASNSHFGAMYSQFSSCTAMFNNRGGIVQVLYWTFERD
jgi:lycopene cyclase CruP